MRENEGKRRTKEGPTRTRPDESLDELLSSYTPKQREKVLRGLRVLARVAVRSFMEDEAARSQDENGSEEEGR